MHLDPVLPRVVAAVFALLLIGLVLRRLRQPHVVAYLLAGVALGPSGLRLFSDEVVLARVGDFGVVLLLFFVGMEVSLPSLLRSWRVSVVGTLLQILASVGSVAVIGWFRDWSLARVLLIGFAISLSSTAVVVSLLRMRKEMDSGAGRDALGVLLIQDLAFIPMLIVLGLLGGEALDSRDLTLQAVGVVGLAALLAVVARREKISLPFSRFLQEDHELQVFSALALCFGLATLTGLLGLSTAVGAFVAGIVVASARETEWVHQSLEPFRVVLVALFFVSVGMLIDLAFLAVHLKTVLLLVLAVFVTNWLINAGILRSLGRPWRHSLYVGALLAQIGEFSFVLVAVGRQTGIIEEFAYQLTIGLIAVTLLLSPLVVSLSRSLIVEASLPRVGAEA